MSTNEDLARLLKEGLDECVRWGDRDNRALLMVEGAELEVRRGKTDDSIATLQVPSQTHMKQNYFAKMKESHHHSLRYTWVSQSTPFVFP